MTQSKLLAVALKLVGVLAVLRAAQFVVSTAAFLVPFGMDGHWPAAGRQLMAMFAVSFVLLAIAGAMFRYGDAIARWLFRKDQVVWQTEQAPGPEWYAAAFAVAGVVLLAVSVPRSLNTIMAYWVGLLEGELGRVFASRDLAMSLVSLGLQVAVSAFLFFGSRQLARTAFWLRGQRLPAADD